MPPAVEKVIAAINNSPLNRGLKGSDWITNPLNISIVDKPGNVMLFDGQGYDVYEAHVLFVDRGAAALALVRAAFREMFADRGAKVILGMVPSFRRDVKLLARWAGMKFVGERATPEGPCELYVLSDEMWKAKQ